MHIRFIRDSATPGSALLYDLAIVARNIADFTIANFEVINPWESAR